MKKYLIVIENATTNYSAFSPDVTGCVTTGGTVEETIANIKKALEFHLEGETELPEPKGLRYHLNAGVFTPGEVSEEYFIAQIQRSGFQQ